MRTRSSGPVPPVTRRRTRSAGAPDAEETLPVDVQARSKLRRVGEGKVAVRKPSGAAAAKPTEDSDSSSDGGDSGRRAPAAREAPPEAAAAAPAAAAPAPAARPALDVKLEVYAAANIQAACVPVTMPPVEITPAMTFVVLDVRRATLTPNTVAVGLGSTRPVTNGYELYVAHIAGAIEGSTLMSLGWRDVFFLHPDVGAGLVESGVIRRGALIKVTGRRIEAEPTANKVVAAAHAAVDAYESKGEDAPPAADPLLPVIPHLHRPAPFYVFKLRYEDVMQPVARMSDAAAEDVLTDLTKAWHPQCPLAGLLVHTMQEQARAVGVVQAAQQPLPTLLLTFATRAKAVLVSAGPVTPSRSLTESPLSEAAINTTSSFKGLVGLRAAPLPRLPLADLRVNGVHDLNAEQLAVDRLIVTVIDAASETLQAAIECFNPHASASGARARATALEKKALAQPHLQVPLIGRLMAVSRLYYWGKPTRADRLPLRFSITLADETMSELLVQFWSHDAARYYAALRALPLGTLVSVQGYRVKTWNGRVEAVVNTRAPGPVVAVVSALDAAAALPPTRLPASLLHRLRFTPAAALLTGAVEAPSDRQLANVCGVVVRVGPWCRGAVDTDPLYEVGTGSVPVAAAAASSSAGAGGGGAGEALPPPDELMDPEEAAAAAGVAAAIADITGARADVLAAAASKELFLSSRGLLPPGTLPLGTAAALQAAVSITGIASAGGDGQEAAAAEPLQALADAVSVVDRLRLTSAALGAGPGIARYNAWRWVWVLDETADTPLAVKLYDGSQTEVIEALAPGDPVALYRVKVVAGSGGAGGGGARPCYLVSTPQTSVFAGKAGAALAQQPPLWRQVVAQDTARVRLVQAAGEAAAGGASLGAFVFGLRRLQHWAEAAWREELLVHPAPGASTLPLTALPKTLGPALPDDPLTAIDFRSLIPRAVVPPPPPALLPSSLTRPPTLGHYCSLLTRTPLFAALPAAAGGRTANPWASVPVLPLSQLRALLSYGTVLRGLAAASMRRRGALGVADPATAALGLEEMLAEVEAHEAAAREERERAAEAGGRAALLLASPGGAAPLRGSASPLEVLAEGPLSPPHVLELLNHLPTLQPGQLLRLIVLAKVVRIDASLPDEPAAAGARSSAAAAPAAMASPRTGGLRSPAAAAPASSAASRRRRPRLSLPPGFSGATAAGTGEGPSQAAERALTAAITAAAQQRDGSFAGALAAAAAFPVSPRRPGSSDSAATEPESGGGAAAAAAALPRRPLLGRGLATAAAAAVVASEASTPAVEPSPVAAPPSSARGAAASSSRRLSTAGRGASAVVDNPLLARMSTEEDVARMLAALAAGKDIDADMLGLRGAGGADASTEGEEVAGGEADDVYMRRGRLHRRSSAAAAALPVARFMDDDDEEGGVGEGHPADDEGVRGGAAASGGLDASSDSGGASLLQRLPLARGGRRVPVTDLSLAQAARVLLPPPTRAQALAEMHEDEGDAEWGAAAAEALAAGAAGRVMPPLYTLLLCDPGDAAETEPPLRVPLLPSALLPLAPGAGVPVPRFPSSAPVNEDTGADAVTPPIDGLAGEVAPAPVLADVAAALEAETLGVDATFLRAAFPPAPPTSTAAASSSSGSNDASAFVQSILDPSRVFALCVTVQQRGLDVGGSGEGADARGRGARRPVVRLEAVYDAVPGMLRGGR